MPYKLRSLSTFNNSFNEIVDYLSEISPSISLRFINELNQQVEAMSGFPYIYPVYEYDERFRKMSISDWKYIVFYTVDQEKQEIILYDVLHMLRDIATYLKDKFK